MSGESGRPAVILRYTHYGPGSGNGAAIMHLQSVFGHVRVVALPPLAYPTTLSTERFDAVARTSDAAAADLSGVPADVAWHLLRYSRAVQRGGLPLIVARHTAEGVMIGYYRMLPTDPPEMIHLTADRAERIIVLPDPPESDAASTVLGFTAPESTFRPASPLRPTPHAADTTE